LDGWNNSEARSHCKSCCKNSTEVLELIADHFHNRKNPQTARSLPGLSTIKTESPTPVKTTQGIGVVGPPHPLKNL
jgi:hypothetical protein